MKSWLATLLLIATYTVRADEVASQSARSVLEWLNEIRAELACPPDPAQLALLSSAVMATHSKLQGVPHDPSLYPAWLGGRGAALMDKVSAKAPLDSAEEREEPLAVHALLARAKQAKAAQARAGDLSSAEADRLHTFWEDTRTNGQAVMRRVYAEGVMTAADLQRRPPLRAAGSHDGYRRGLAAP